MSINYKQPEWFFYPFWVVLSTLAIPIALGITFIILKILTDQIGGYIMINGQKRITEDYLFMFVFVPLFCLLTGFVQYLLLRRYLPQMGWWILVTGLGWLSVMVSLQLMNFMLANLSILLGFPLIGALIGFFQWLLLRRHITQAAWWILASTLGWGLAALGNQTPVKNGSILAQLLVVGLIPALVTGLAWWYLLKPEEQQENQGA